MIDLKNSSNNIALNIHLTSSSGNNNPILEHRTQSRQEVRRFIHQIERTFEETGNLFTIEFDLECGHHLRMLCAIGLSTDGCAEHAQTSEDSVSSSTSSIRVGTAEREQLMTPEEIMVYVEQALQDFHSTARLSKNPLVELIDLTTYRSQRETLSQNRGAALKQLLEQIITAISGISSDEKLSRSQWRLEHYLHLRYREGILHKDLASHLGYTDRHLLRLRRELILEAAELIIGQSW
ncbi:MAG: hypothetical protein AAF702_49010 [Chloroflexota bacterium]